MKVLFRADASIEIGIGHIRRCLSLATALQDRGVMPLFVINDATGSSNWPREADLPTKNLQGVVSWSTEDASCVLAAAKAWDCSSVVVDSDFEGEVYLRRLRDEGLVVCAIEDLAPHPFPCQLVVNGDIHAQMLPYVSSSGDTVFLLGPGYAILRREFWDSPPPQVRGEVKHVLLVFGGSDPFGLTPRAVSGLDSLPGTFTITAILGPLYTNNMEIEQVASQARHQVRTVRAPQAVRDLMLSADLAVSAGGQTLYELAWAGCPTIAAVTAVNQDDQVRVFEQEGFVESAGHAADPGVIDRIVTAARRLMNDRESRAAMSRAGQRLVDGRGAVRVADAIFGVADGRLARGLKAT